MLSDFLRVLLEGSAQIAGSMPKTIVFFHEKPSSFWLEYGSLIATTVSAGATVATALWAYKSGRIAKELRDIERNRFEREGQLLKLYQPSDEPLTLSLGSVMNIGQSATKIEKAYISTNKDSSGRICEIQIGEDTANYPGGPPNLGTVLKPGSTLNFLVSSHDNSELKNVISGPKNLYLILHVIHQSEPITMGFVNRCHGNLDYILPE